MLRNPSAALWRSKFPLGWSETERRDHEKPLDLEIWPWVKTYDAIFGWMNIHLPSILMFTRCQGFDPLPYASHMDIVKGSIHSLPGWFISFRLSHTTLSWWNYVTWQPGDGSSPEFGKCPMSRGFWTSHHFQTSVGDEISPILGWCDKLGHLPTPGIYGTSLYVPVWNEPGSSC